MKENAANSNLYFANKEDERTWSDSRRCRLKRRWRFARAVVASGKSLKHDPDGPVTQSQTNPDWSSKIGPKYSIFSRRWKRQTNKGDDRQSTEQFGAQTRSRFYEGSTNWTETKKKIGIEFVRFPLFLLTFANNPELAVSVVLLFIVVSSCRRRNVEKWDLDEHIQATTLSWQIEP